MLRSSLYDYRDAYILVSGTAMATGARVNDAAKRLDERNKGVIFKICEPFTEFIGKINNTEIDNTKYMDVAMVSCLRFISIINSNDHKRV